MKEKKWKKVKLKFTIYQKMERERVREEKKLDKVEEDGKEEARGEKLETV